ncbi:excalibur calcium-binding domain-containing protein [Exiguobacterium aurantiacum]|uniref:excalibur calcium-binding domain-containing protein n=1 Tax=Exiguobacterium aurantiacum TaxID=33987 RepID=UPI003CFC4DB5
MKKKQSNNPKMGFLEYSLAFLILMPYLGPSLFHAIFDNEPRIASSSDSDSSSSISLFPDRQPKPGDRHYYATCRELKEVYPDGVKAGANAYRDALDADKDGTACEPY